MKMTVIYHSKSGNTKKMAECIIGGMNSVPGVEAAAFSIDEVDLEFARESKAIVVGTPVYGANMSGATKMYLENNCRELQLPGKIVGAFATANYAHGGGDLAIQTILIHLIMMGGLAYSGGSAHGLPVIHLGPVALGPELDSYAELFGIYGKRMAEKAAELFNQ